MQIVSTRANASIYKSLGDMYLGNISVKEIRVVEDKNEKWGNGITSFWELIWH